VTTLPVIGVMLTQPSREGLAVRAITDFVNQTVPRKSLYVYTTDHDYAIRLMNRFMPQLGTVFVVAARPGSTPQDMLRAGLSQARETMGYVALWDDDIRHHPGRLERQTVQTDDANRPSLLSSGVWHFFDSDELFVYRLDKRHEPLKVRLVGSTLVCRAERVTDDLIPVKYTGSPTHALGMSVVQRYDAVRPTDEWWWMVFGVRGDNAGGYEFHRKWATNKDRCPSAAWLRENQVLLRHWLGQYAWDVPRLDVCGQDGVAFQFEPPTLWGPEVPPVGEPEGFERVREVLQEETNNG